MRRGEPRIAARGPDVRGNQRALPMMVLTQILGGQDGQVRGRGKIADHHLAPRPVVHRELAVPEAIRHGRLDLLATGRPLNGVARAHVDDAAFARLVIRQLEFATHVLREQPQHRRLSGRRHRGELVEKNDDQIAFVGQPRGVARPCHRQQANTVGRGYRKAAEILRLSNRADQDDHLALDSRARESRLETLGELGLPYSGKAGDVDGDACLQANGNQLDEMRELHPWLD